MTQLALETAYMTLDEVAADHTQAFDDVVAELEREALEDAERDDEARVEPEFGPLAHIGTADDPEDGLL